MDGDRFDQLTRQLAAGATRRRVLGGLAAGVGAALSAVAVAGAAQIRRTPGAICRKTGDCVANAVCQSTSTGRSVCTCVTGYKPCGKICIPTSSCCTAADCADDGKECTTTVCTNYVCGHVNRPNGTTCSDGNACTTGDTCQNGDCVGTPVTCPTCQTCSGGTCVPIANNTPCGVDHACCGGTCTDMTTNQNCVTCGNACNQVLSGASVACFVVADPDDPAFGTLGCTYTCNPGFEDCDNSSSNGCETDIKTVTNCGGCGLTCPDTYCCRGCRCYPPDQCDPNIGAICQGGRGARLIR